MRATLSILGLIFGTLSVVMLIQQGFNYGIVSPLQLILDYYDQAMQTLFGWSEPWLRSQLETLGRWFGWDAHLYPHWKYVFVLTWLYIFPWVRVWFSHRAWGYATYLSVVGISISLAVALACGVVDLAARQDLGVRSFLIVAIPVVGIALFGIARKVGAQHLLQYEADAPWLEIARPERIRLSLGLCAMFAAFVLAELTVLPQLGNVGLMVLGLLVFGLASFEIGRGLAYASRLKRKRPDIVNEHGGVLSAALGAGRTGTDVLKILAGTGVYLATNAGLKLAGL